MRLPICLFRSVCLFVRASPISNEYNVLDLLFDWHFISYGCEFCVYCLIEMNKKDNKQKLKQNNWKQNSRIEV